jgi:uncharacterized protein (TIGR02246 family)
MMWRGFALAVVGTVLACARPQTAASPNAGRAAASDEQAIRRVEEEVVAATDHNDAATLDRLFAPDWTFVNPAGILLDKERFLGMMRAGTLHLGSYTVDSMSVRVYGAAAVVIYRSSVVGTLRGTDITSRRRRTTFLIKRGGQWLVVAQQSTPIVGG